MSHVYLHLCFFCMLVWHAEFFFSELFYLYPGEKYTCSCLPGIFVICISHNILSSHAMATIQIVCLGFYSVSTVFQLFNGDSSQIPCFLDYVSLTTWFSKSEVVLHLIEKYLEKKTKKVLKNGW